MKGQHDFNEEQCDRAEHFLGDADHFPCIYHSSVTRKYKKAYDYFWKKLFLEGVRCCCFVFFFFFNMFKY